MRTIETTVYNFSELSEEAKEKAISYLSDINVDHDWFDYIYDDAKNIGLEITEFDLDRASYAKGNFMYDAKYTADNIIREHGAHCDTAKTAQDYLVTLKTETDKVLSEYSNKECPEDYLDDFLDTEDIDAEFLRSLLEDYRIMLSKEYDYLTSEAAIIETIEANEYEFLDNGKLV